MSAPDSTRSWRSRLAVGLIVALTVGWAVVLFWGLPFLYGRKVTALVGHDEDTVRQELGPPTRAWDSPDFVCDRPQGCGGQSAGGPVWLYADGEQHWYLFFDAKGRLAMASPQGVGLDAG